MNPTALTFIFISIFLTSIAQANPQWLSPYAQLYEHELGTLQTCTEQDALTARWCSPILRNDGNAPFVLHHVRPTAETVVLFHGLSDSPFFLRSIAKTIHQQGMTVVVALLPGHGKRDAASDMEDGKLAQRWREHVARVIEIADSFSQTVYVGGFSTGGALATEYALANPKRIDGLMLFSGALALDDTVENMSQFWGIKWLAKWMDGDYQSIGPNPYKYASVSKHAAMMLADIIFSVREQLDEGKRLGMPMFVAHSMADTTTPWRGVKQLLDANDGDNVVFLAEASREICHADLVVSAPQLVAMNYDMTQADNSAPCAVPRANPMHGDMLEAMQVFLHSH